MIICWESQWKTSSCGDAGPPTLQLVCTFKLARLCSSNNPFLHQCFKPHQLLPVMSPLPCDSLITFPPHIEFIASAAAHGGCGTHPFSLVFVFGFVVLFLFDPWPSGVFSLWFLLLSNMNCVGQLSWPASLCWNGQTLWCVLSNWVPPASPLLLSCCSFALPLSFPCCCCYVT